MEISYCPSCEKETGHKRMLGWGTLLGCIFTFGLWILSIPFYPKRCIICGHTSNIPESARPWYRTWQGVTAIAVVLLFIVILAKEKEHPQPQQHQSSSIPAPEIPLTVKGEKIKSAHPGWSIDLQFRRQKAGASRHDKGAGPVFVGQARACKC